MTLPIASCDTVAINQCRNVGDSCDTVATRGDAACPFERRELLKELMDKGVRITAQRRVVIEIIQQAMEHLDAASLLAMAQEKEPGIDRATIYRTIKLLKKHRLVDELDLMHLQGEKHFYEVKTRRDHVHLACFECGQIEEFSNALFERLKDEIRTRAGFEIRATRLEVGGRCKACITKESKERAPKTQTMSC